MPAKVISDSTVHCVQYCSCSLAGYCLHKTYKSDAADEEGGGGGNLYIIHYTIYYVYIHYTISGEVMGPSGQEQSQTKTHLYYYQQQIVLVLYHNSLDIAQAEICTVLHRELGPRMIMEL